MTTRINYIIKIIDDMPEFTQSNTLSSMAYSANNQKKFTTKKISEVVTQLRELREEYNGSEVQTSMMEKKVEFIQTLEDQLDSLTSFEQDCKDAYREVTGSDWIPPSKAATTRKTETQAALETDALLAKYQ